MEQKFTAKKGRDRAELQVAAVISAALGGVTGYLLSNLVESGGRLKNTYLGARWFSPRQWRGFLFSGVSFVSASSRRSPPRLGVCSISVWHDRSQCRGGAIMGPYRH
jgi:hypothetical protein